MLTSAPVPPLPAAQLRRACDPASLPFATTPELQDFADVLGQSRAVEAIRFGVGMERDGYNLYAMGPERVRPGMWPMKNIITRETVLPALRESFCDA